MNRASWTEPIATASGETATAILLQLWSEAERVQAAISDPAKLRALLGFNDQRKGPRFVHVVSSAPADSTLPTSWRYTVVAQLSAPDLLLFYRSGSSFPDSGLLFTGGIGNHSWVTYYRRPIVLHHLRQRFTRLAAEMPAGAGLMAGSIREEPARPSILKSSSEERSAANLESVVPTELYRRILSVHFSDTQQDDSAGNAGPSLAVHQARAYERACDILDRFGGVIIADAVGLGKTYIGLRLVQRTLHEGGRVVVVVPAALRDQWSRELAYLGPCPNNERPSQDSPEDSDNLDLWVREDQRITLFSQESLGQSGFNAAANRGADLVLVDEAHNFRNPATRRYRALSDMVRHSNVVLLTATPINNTVFDLQHLIDLFAAPGAFRHLGVTDYRVAFRHVSEDGGPLQTVISACVLRRTRRFLREHYGSVHVRDPRTGDDRELHFPKRRPPIAVSYDLQGTYGGLFEGLEEWMDALRFPSIELHQDRAEGTEPNACPAELLKIILLKRLESSTEAFRSTVVQQLAWCSTALRAIEAGRVLTRPDYRAGFRGPADDPGSQLAFFELMLPVPSVDSDRLEEFRNGLENDLAILSRIHATLVAVGPGGDRKLTQLMELLDGPLADQKTIIFTEFRDTARYLYHQVRNRPYVAQIDSERAHLGLERSSRTDVIQRFAPRSNNVPMPPTRERVDVLIATDVLSEGLNLQDAAVVVSYDLPWNPVRLMQRAGRIDRLGALHEFVQLYHFTPASDLERLLGLMTRLHKKITSIRSTLGLDHPPLAASTDQDRAAQHVRLLAQRADGFDVVENEIEGPLDPEEQAYLDCVRLVSATNHLPSERAAIAAVIDTNTTTPHAIAYWRLTCGDYGRGLWMSYDLDSGSVAEDQSGVVSALQAARSMTPCEASKATKAIARRAFTAYAQGVLARLQAARIAGDALSPNLPQCRIAAWLRRGYDSRPGHLTRDQRATADRLLVRLSRRFTIAGERQLAEFAARLPELPDDDWLNALGHQLATLETAGSGRVGLREVGILLILPPRP